MSSELERPVSPTLGSEEARGDKPHQRLPALITAAFEERDPKEQRRLSTEVIETLIAMRAPGDEADEARLIVAHLDAKTLTGLVDQKGRRAHTEAVETLLSLGFPHALQVNPEDLKRFRDDPKSLGGQSLARAKALERAGFLAIAGPIAGAVMAVDGMPLEWPIAPAALSIAAGAAATYSLLTGKDGPGRLLLLLSMVLALASAAGSPMFAVVGAFNVLALVAASVGKPKDS